MNLTPQVARNLLLWAEPELCDADFVQSDPIRQRSEIDRAFAKERIRKAMAGCEVHKARAEIRAMQVNRISEHRP